MNLANLFVIIFLTYYTVYMFKLFNGRNRQIIQKVNKKLDVLRKVPVKSIKEQKKFLNLKYPKKLKFEWSWKIIPDFLIQLAIFILIVRIYMYIFDFFDIELRLWFAILFIMIVPILFNIVLERFDLQKSDMRAYLR